VFVGHLVAHSKALIGKRVSVRSNRMLDLMTEIESSTNRNQNGVDSTLDLTILQLITEDPFNQDALMERLMTDANLD
jgi:hypothetical protein